MATVVTDGAETNGANSEIVEKTVTFTVVKSQVLWKQRRKEFKKRLVEIQKKEIERPEALDIEEFAALHEGIALQNLNQFCHVSFTQDDRTFTSQAWNRHSEKEKVTLDDLFLLHSMDKGVSIDVSWHVAKFFADKAKGYKKKSLIVGAHLIGRIARSFGLMTPGALRGVTLGPETSLLNMVDDIPKVAEDEGAGACMGQADVGGVRRHPNMTTTNRLRAMDERLGDIETDISRLVGDVNELTYVVSGMSEQYDQFYGEFGHWRTEQERFLTWNTYHLSQLLAHHHIDHTRYNRTPYAYVPDIPDLGVQQGVNFMSSTPIYSTAPSSSPNPFGLFGDANAGPSTSQNQQDDMNED
ncbi:hypothetical protein Tco_0140306 [Tanacetum coccineum]